MIYLWNFDTTEHKDIRRVFKSFGLYFVGGKSLIEIGQMMVSEKSKQPSAEELSSFIYQYKKDLGGRCRKSVDLRNFHEDCFNKGL